MARRVRPGEALLALWRVSRPAIWLVSVLPFLVGHLLATRRLLPSLHVWTGLLDRAATSGVTSAAAGAAFREALRLDADLLLTGLAVGPLFWAAALFVNDAYDLPGDRLNPRKADTPLVLGVIGPGFARAAAAVTGALALAAGLAAGIAVGVLVAALLWLAWAYSAPPLRLKVRPGADLAVNALGVGGLALLAGWAVERPVAEFPWVMLAQGLLVATALYVPSTLVDLDADRESGYRTMATAWGARTAYRVGWWSWCAACAGAVALSAGDVVLPRSLLPMFAVTCPLLVVEYAVLIGRPLTGIRVLRGIVVCSTTFAIANLGFALRYAGLWA